MCPKRGGGMKVVPNELNKLVQMRQVNGLKVCVDYWKLNALTDNDHLPMPFMD